MECFKCKKQALPDVEYAGKKYCRSHFLELMEKRVRKNLRVRELIDIQKSYYLFDDDSSEAKITEYFLNKIFRGYLKLKIGNKKSGKEIRIVPTNLDEQSIIFLNFFMENKNEKKRKEIMPLEVIQQKEIQILCEILKIFFVPRVKKDILEELEKKYPGTKFSLFQSRMNLMNK